MLDQIQCAFKERDDSEQKLRQFVADASHELRTPITAISAYAEFFAGDAKLDAAALERALGGIQRETERMELLVEDLLALARLDDGAIGPRHLVELVRLCADALEAAAEIAPAWPVTLAASSPIEVVGDEEQLHRAVSNLFSNVRQHTEAGTTTTITIRSGRDTAVIEVRDDGPGMTAEEARHAFDRFYRGDPSRSRSRGGSGLGLAIVRSIALAHGGTATLESSEGAGTLVRLALPLAAPLS
jgi:two-component system OmpR family sensor kinase